MAYRPPGLTQLLRRLRSDPPSAGWTRLSRRILVLPAGDEVVVGESNETGWTPVLSQVETFDAVD